MPPWLRMRGPVVFPAMMFPKKCVNYSLYIEHTVKQIAALSPAKSRGIRIKGAVGTFGYNILAV